MWNLNGKVNFWPFLNLVLLGFAMVTWYAGYNFLVLLISKTRFSFPFTFFFLEVDFNGEPWGFFICFQLYFANLNHDGSFYLLLLFCRFWWWTNKVFFFALLLFCKSKIEPWWTLAILFLFCKFWWWTMKVSNCFTSIL